ncbi:Maf family protein [Heyndrickxia ginsengihumi]|uniref:Maf family protein n=1 Tax=Heyndrickxia ginsengihumi TaxID=363870 RepID=UPI00203FE066|nr:Maf family protein [Heyndrickxia ginsengihumi]MCM3021886.1 Maf family protein [Heyndrickxia ginsengihumi]
MSNLILASSSPRRKELLQTLQIPFDIVTSNVDESFQPKTAPETVVMDLACRKAEAVAKHHPESVVVGADTLVVFEEQFLGKPKDREHALHMLQTLSGRTHSVYTGVAVYFQHEMETFYELTEVTFWNLSLQEIEHYLNSGESFDKAGAYGIQGLGSLFVRNIHGDYYNVVGLPISRLNRLLANPRYSCLHKPFTS